MRRPPQDFAVSPDAQRAGAPLHSVYNLVSHRPGSGDPRLSSGLPCPEQALLDSLSRLCWTFSVVPLRYCSHAG